MPQQRAVRVEWTGTGLTFRGGGTEPAGCSGADVVVILEKMRMPIRGLSIDVTGTRRDEQPRRYTDLTFRFRAEGDGVDAAKVERAVALSIEKYCSVVASLAPDLRVEYEIEVV